MTTTRKAAPQKRWSQHVTETSDAMDLETGVFKKTSPRAVASSLKRSVEKSHRRKAGPFQSAMSMLNFEINRGGKNLSATQRRVLERAKVALREIYGKEPAKKKKKAAPKRKGKAQSAR